MIQSSPTETIVALATPAGRGGVGIVRISGPLSKAIGNSMVDKKLIDRQAIYSGFYSDDQQIIDRGLALFFQGPNSYTGEDVLELQGHGGPYVMDEIIERALSLGARMATPGEFTERAFLNDKIDLVQAEAIADLIEAGSREAARSAAQSLQGVFSEKIHNLTEQMTELRIFVEAAIDFPEEEIDFLADVRISNKLEQIVQQLNSILSEAQQGAILREGIHAVIVGKPNAGKSSLLNALAGQEAAIVTHIEGTTRDTLREHIQIDGIPMYVTDTAGIREASDEVEKIGIERTKQEINKADLILLVVDAHQEQQVSLSSLWPEQVERPDVPVLLIRNKVDLTDEEIKSDVAGQQIQINISAKHNQGLDLLKQQMKNIIGYQDQQEGRFMARRRHLKALESCQEHLDLATAQLKTKAGELVAEELRLCQQHLSEITGEFTADDLLGKIFSSFCIGK